MTTPLGFLAGCQVTVTDDVLLAGIIFIALGGESGTKHKEYNKNICFKNISDNNMDGSIT